MNEWSYKGWGPENCLLAPKQVYHVSRNTLRFVVTSIELSSTSVGKGVGVMHCLKCDTNKGFIRVRISAPRLGTPGPPPVLGVALTLVLEEYLQPLLVHTVESPSLGTQFPSADTP